MQRMRGPAIFASQLIGDRAPFDTLAAMAAWAANLGYTGIQVPTHLPAFFDLGLAAESQDYCDDIAGLLASHGVSISELSTHLQGQLIAVHPAYDALFDGFAPPDLQGRPAARRAWAEMQLGLAAQASRRLGLTAHATFSGALAWPYLYPWPPRQDALVATAYAELAARWRPILDAFDAAGVDLCFEVHPGEDIHDGVTFERFLDAVDGHPRCSILYDPSHLVLQQLDYLAFIDIYHSRIKAFHVKDAEFNPTGRQGVYGGFSAWSDRAGRFRSPGDGQVDFTGIFSRLAQHGYAGWAVLEWECCIKSAEQGAREGGPFISRHMIDAGERAFDDFAGGGADEATFRSILGL